MVDEYGRSREDYASVEVEGVTCVHATDKALKVRFFGPGSDDPRERWVPRASVVEDESEVLDEGDEGSLVLWACMAEEKGMV